MLELDLVIFSFSLVSKTHDINLLGIACINNYQTHILNFTAALSACTLTLHNEVVMHFY